MKLLITILSGLLCMSALGQSEESDRYSVHLVQTALKTRSKGLLVAKIHTHIARLGDAVSIALLKILTKDDLTQPQSVQGFLPIIREAFSQVQFVTNEIDKKPKVTLFLLEHVRQDVPDAQVQRDIEETIRFVKQETGE